MLGTTLTYRKAAISQSYQHDYRVPGTPPSSVQGLEYWPVIFILHWWSEQVRMSVIWATIGGNRTPLNPGLDYFCIQWILLTYHSHLKKKKLLIKMGCFSWNQMLSEVWGYPGKRVREGKSGYLQHHQKCCLEKEMTIHSSILAWRIPETEEPGGFMSLKVRHDSVSKQQLY